MQRLSPAGFPAISRKTKVAAAWGSLLYVFVLLTAWAWIHGGLSNLGSGLFTVQVGPWIVYAFGGGPLVGASLAVSVVRYRLVTPVLAVALVFGVMMYRMWQAMQAPFALLPGTPYDLYIVGWPVVLGTAIAVGFVEHVARTRR